MNVLFMTLVDIDSIYLTGIYADLIREFDKNGCNMYVISPVEKKTGVKTHIIKESNTTILKLRIGNTQKTNVIEKGISILMIEKIFRKAIKKYFSEIKFDLILYSTPPITLTGPIEYVKKRDNAKTYLLLKDIFPQNAVDIGMMNKTGVRSALYKYFRNKEKKLYAISDRIGCMSKANVEYVIEHNPEINPNIVEICPNSVDPIDMSVDEYTRVTIRKKYGIPLDKKVFVYGGNLGKPQGIVFFIRCLESQKDNEDVYFLIVGDGTEYGKIESYIENSKQNNVKLMKRLPKEDYDKMVGACDVGMIFLDHRFTIPNFPSRLLSYMQARIPVLAVTDPNTDLSEKIINGNFGWWCESNDSNKFYDAIKVIVKSSTDFERLGNNAYEYLKDNYDVYISYEKIISKMVV